MSVLKFKDANSSWVTVPVGGVGVPSGGMANQILVKSSSTDYATGWRAFVDLVYPVGSIYMSVNSTSPATLFGGTWERIQDTFLLAAGTNHAAGSTGGEENHVLTVNEMPGHAGHVVESTRGGNFNGYLDVTKMSSYGSSGRGWNTIAGNEVLPYGETLGGGQAHNNMPPFLAVYVWKRTA